MRILVQIKVRDMFMVRVMVGVWGRFGLVERTRVNDTVNVRVKVSNRVRVRPETGSG